MNKIWLTTDTHFGHDDIIGFCNRPKNFEELLFDGLMKIPGDDILIHLGDVGLGGDGSIHAKYIWPLMCKKILVRGNHDHKSNSWYLDHGWDFVCEQILDRLYGSLILFSHVPQPDIGYDINVHGHFHNSGHHDHEAKLIAIKNVRQKLLAVEYTNYQPVKLEKFIKNSWRLEK